MKEDEDWWTCERCGYEDSYKKKDMIGIDEMECPFCCYGKMKRDSDIE